MSIPVVILISESKSTFWSTITKKYQAFLVRSGKQALKVAQENQIPPSSFFVLDAHSLGTSGERICRLIREEHPQAMILHIFPANTVSPSNPLADLVWVAPISARKLINAINRLIHARKHQQLLECGPFTFDESNRILIAHGDEITLTPKQSALVAVFLKHPNETLTRDWLMREVWETDYTGDTGTLSVHIRWLRNALEQNHKGAPRYLLTVRGVGYRLKID